MPNKTAQESEQARAREDFESIAEDYIEGEISLDDFNSQMKDRLSAYYLTLALLAVDGEEIDTAVVEGYVADAYDLIDDLTELLEENEDISRNYILWRAGIFSFGHHVYTRYTVDEEIFRLMPVFPGVDCLGDGACGCDLVVDTSDDGVSVEWILGAKEHCVVCVAAAISSPYEFSWDLINSEIDD